MAAGPDKAALQGVALQEDDIGVLYEALYPARSSYRKFGLQIGVDRSNIDGIERNEKDCGVLLLQVLTMRIKQDEKLTWNDIYSALKSVDESSLADAMKHKYGHRFSPCSSIPPEHEHETQLHFDEGKTGKAKIVQIHHQKNSDDSHGEVSEEKTPSMKRPRSEKDVDTMSSEESKYYVKKRKEEEMVSHLKVPEEEISHEKPKGKKQYERMQGMQESKAATGTNSEASDTISQKMGENQPGEKSKARKALKEVNSESYSEVSTSEDSSQILSKSIKLFQLPHHRVKTYRPKLTKGKKGKKYRKKIRGKDKLPQRERSLKRKHTQYYMTVNTSEDPSESERLETEESFYKGMIYEEESTFEGSQHKEKAKSFSKQIHGETDKDLQMVKASSYSVVVLHEEEANVDIKQHGMKPDSGLEKEKYEKSGLHLKQTESVKDTMKTSKREESSGKKTLGSVTPMQAHDESETNSEESYSGYESSEDGEGSEEERNILVHEDSSTAPSEEERRREWQQKKLIIAKARRKVIQRRRRRGFEKSKKISEPSLVYNSPGDDEHSGHPHSSRGQTLRLIGERRSKKRYRESSTSPPSSLRPISTEEKKMQLVKRQRMRGREISVYSGTGMSWAEDDKEEQQHEGKELVNIFERFFGRLCTLCHDPIDTAIKLQEKEILPIQTIKQIILSPESQQAKIIFFVDELHRVIKFHPYLLFPCMEVMLENEALQETAREILREAGSYNMYLMYIKYTCLRQQNCFLQVECALLKQLLKSLLKYLLLALQNLKVYKNYSLSHSIVVLCRSHAIMAIFFFNSFVTAAECKSI